MHPLYFEFPSQTRDDVKLQLPLAWSVKSVPPAQNQDQKLVAYTLKVEDDKGEERIVRQLKLDLLGLDQKYYGALRNFFQQGKQPMNNKSSCNPVASARTSRWLTAARVTLVLSVGAAILYAAPAKADAPPWMHALTSVPVPDHDEKADAVLLYSEEILTVQPNGKIKRLSRRAYKILRASGKEYGAARAHFDFETKILNMHGWCIPAQGKDFEVKEKDALETSLPGVANGELVSDIRAKILPIPASDPGSIVGWEIEQEERPFVFQELWSFQTIMLVRETRFTLQLPPGWESKATWLNYTEVKPTGSGNQWQWVINDVKALRPEMDMPPLRGLEGQLLITLLPPGGSDKKGFENWAEMGKWEGNLAQGRRDPSPELKQKVADLTDDAGEDAGIGKLCSARHSLCGD